MVDNNLYITCKVCKSRINLTRQKSSILECHICVEPYYVSYHINRVNIYEKRDGGFYGNTNMIFSRSYFRW